MALQDGLLSFAIKETIFLSSDKAGIGELQELELVPDVEVLENETYISITGCLQLFGKYEPIREAAEANGGGTETLVEAMTFSPFRQEATEEGFYGWEEQLGHRIPLNITIPLERIAEIGDIYAIVDSFDYKLESPHQMLIDAELKIMGIAFAEQAQAQAQVEEPEQQIHPQYYDQNEETVHTSQEEAWEFAHVASEEQENEVQPVSLDEIEQKLSELENEMERQAMPASYDSAESESPSLYDAPALSTSYQGEYVMQSYGEVTEEVHRESQEVWGAESTGYESAAYDSASYDTQAIEAEYDERWTDVRSQEEEQDEPVLAIHEQEPPDYTPVATEQHESPAVAEVVEMLDSAEATEVHVDLQMAAEPVIAEQEADEEVELRVAISGKASREEPGNVNITSIFSQASRAKQEALAQEAESSSSSSRKGMASSAAPTTTEAMQNLTSFVKSKEERSSQLKMCIIQRDETLEHIAQRYSMPVSKIVEVNRLATEQLVAGQILYIPQ
ncbi:LysM peptidoglycan-binding domain-containing protein [uncultured Brevibacillus sp.]|uniref:LysM peptidoglycan-binding domain-containing protein n=1 Tax=uncultured Brevibacillus sp. TaxID=169970 RepID=UPI002592F883|nr:LysM peptidoglycan-binding domain-containing protein [uncultured Brevibacillus sp.]